MHVQGVIEVNDGQSWVGVDDLPHLPPAACPPVFGQPAGETESTEPEGRTAVAPGRGIPSDASDLLERRYYKDRSSVYGDTGPWHHAFGEAWVRADELPATVAADNRWADVCDALAAHEREYGPANVRLVVWFEE